MWRAVRVSGAVVALVLTAACSGGGSQQQPYAADIRALESSPVELVREVVVDGQILEQEFREVQGVYLTCLRDRGFPADVWVDEYGTESYQYDGDQTDGEGELSQAFESALSDCEEASGLGMVENLYWAAVKNPDRVDFNDLIAQCLREVGLVEPSYTGERYAEDLKVGTRPGGDGGAEDLLRCENDPLATMGEP